MLDMFLNVCMCSVAVMAVLVAFVLISEVVSVSFRKRNR